MAPPCGSGFGFSQIQIDINLHCLQLYCNFAPGIYPRPACGVLARRCRAAHARVFLCVSLVRYTRARNGVKKLYAAARLFLPCRVRFPLCVSAVVARVRGCLVFGLSRMIRSNSGCARKEIAPCFAGLSLYLKNRQARPPPSSKAAVPL